MGWGGVFVDKRGNKEANDTMLEFRGAVMSTCIHKMPIWTWPGQTYADSGSDIRSPLCPSLALFHQLWIYKVA